MHPVRPTHWPSLNPSKTLLKAGISGATSTVKWQQWDQDSLCELQAAQTHHSALLVGQEDADGVAGFGRVWDFAVIGRAALVPKLLHNGGGDAAGAIKDRILQPKPIADGLPSSLDVLHWCGLRRIGRVRETAMSLPLEWCSLLLTQQTSAFSGGIWSCPAWGGDQATRAGYSSPTAHNQPGSWEHLTSDTESRNRCGTPLLHCTSGSQEHFTSRVIS